MRFEFKMLKHPWLWYAAGIEFILILTVAIVIEYWGHAPHPKPNRHLAAGEQTEPAHGSPPAQTVDNPLILRDASTLQIH